MEYSTEKEILQAIYERGFEGMSEVLQKLFNLAMKLVEVNRRRNRKSLRYTLIRDRSGREKSWFLQGNACQGNSSKLQSLTAEVCRTFTGMQS